MAFTVSSSLISKLKNIKERSQEIEEELCNFCGKTISPDHRHLLDINTGKFKCACEVCTIIQSVHGYKLIPDHYNYLKDFIMPEELWSEFMIPVNMAFFVFNSAQNGIVTYYPAAAGATESKLKMEAWKKLEQLNPVIKKLSKDVEALLLNRLGDAGEYFIVPIDCCYKLIGTLRSHWHGIHGGREVDEAIANFFYQLKVKVNA